MRRKIMAPILSFKRKENQKYIRYWRSKMSKSSFGEIETSFLTYNWFVFVVNCLNMYIFVFISSIIVNNECNYTQYQFFPVFLFFFTAYCFSTILVFSPIQFLTYFVVFSLICFRYFPGFASLC